MNTLPQPIAASARPAWMTFAHALHDLMVDKPLPQVPAASPSNPQDTEAQVETPDFWDGYNDVRPATNEATADDPEPQKSQTTPQRSLYTDLPLAFACAQIAQLLPDLPAMEAVMAPGAITTLVLSEHRLLDKAKKILSQQFEDIRDADPSRCGKISLANHVQFILEPEDHVKSKSKVAQDFTKALSYNAPIVILLCDATALRHPLQLALPKPLACAERSQAMLMFALELAFGAFNTVEEAELYQALPADADLNALTPEALDLAFRGQSALAIAAALNNLVARKKAKGGAGLDALAGMGELSSVAATLVADLAVYKAGQLAWSDLPRGILLYGGPGTGKTYAVGCIARAANVPLIAATVGGWQSAGHLGDMLKAMKASFDEARSNAPCVLFIDELDSLGSRQSKDKNSNYRTQVINEMLAQMDGIAGLEGVILIGATNDPHAIDPAIQRPGRLDRHIAVPLPGRLAIEAQVLRHLGADAAHIDLPAVMRLTRGKTPAELAAALRLARAQARQARTKLSTQDVLEHLRPAPLSIEREWIVALHEAGHAMVGHLLGVGRPTELRIDNNGGETRMRLNTSTGRLETVENKMAYFFGGPRRRNHPNRPRDGGRGRQCSLRSCHGH